MSVLITNDTSTANKFTIITNNKGDTNVGLFATTPSYGPLINFLIVAGGGGGGNYSGGGAGGVVVGSFSNFLKKDTLFITVGAGGAINTNGGNSSIRVGNFYAPIIAYGGGGGGGVTNSTTTIGFSGGSGGGACGVFNVSPYGTTLTVGGPVLPGLGGVSYGNSGGGNTIIPGSYITYDTAGGGGGGAGTPGFRGDVVTPKNGNGGIGIINPITDSTVGQLSAGNYWIAGGGGGGIVTGYGPVAPGPGGPGGGGSSGISDTVPTPATAGAANTGGGGGGSADLDYDIGMPTGVQAAGGSGVVVVTYNNSTQLANGGTVTNPSSNYWIHTFTSSGTLTFI